jgi:hypothetical protein
LGFCQVKVGKKLYERDAFASGQWFIFSLVAEMAFFATRLLVMSQKARFLRQGFIGVLLDSL